MKLGGVDPVVAGEGPGCWQPARVNSAPDCGLWLPRYLRGFAEVQHRQSLASGNLPRNVRAGLMVSKPTLTVFYKRLSTQAKITHR